MFDQDVLHIFLNVTALGTVFSGNRMKRGELSRDQ